MILGIDMDGVLANFQAGFVPLLAKRGYTQFDLKDPNFPSVWEWATAGGVPAAVEKECWAEVKQDENFWYNLPPYPNGRADVDALVQARIRGNDIYFITNRPGKTSKIQTEGWLKLYGYLDPTVLVSADKAGCTKALKIDAYVDDKPGNLEGHGESVGLFMPLQPYNKYYMDDPTFLTNKVTAVLNVREVLKAIGA